MRQGFIYPPAVELLLVEQLQRHLAGFSS